MHDLNIPNDEVEILKKVLSLVPQSIFWKDSQFVYLGCNAGFARLLGFESPAEITGKTDYDLAWKKEDADFYRACDQQVLETAKPMLNTEETILQQDGKKAIFLCSRFPLRNDQGKVIGILGVLTDVTEKKRLENHLRQSQKIDAIRRLAGGMAHEFNNLLTVMGGYAELRMELLPKGDPIRADLEQILKAADRARNLTAQLLSFSRQQVHQPQILQMNDILMNTTSMLRRLIPENIELVMLPSDNLECVKMDPGHMEQILVNLVSNSRDALTQGGKIIIQTRNETLSAEYERTHVGISAGDYVMVMISDSGVGMSEQTIEHLFEPFFTTKDKSKGAGLGLAVTYGIVKQAGGFITCASELGKGTIFKVYLPRVKESKESIQINQTEGPLSFHGNETILLVEDEPMLRALAFNILKDCGYHVLQASNGDEALRVAKLYGHKPIHLVVTDVIMPQMSGKEFIEKLKPLRPQTRILYASGYLDDVISHQGIAEQGDFFIQKPYSYRALAARVREVLDGSRE